MKIIYLSNSKIPSSNANSVHVMKMCQAFKQLDCSVSLYCEKGKQIVDSDEVFQKYGITDRFNIHAYNVSNKLNKVIPHSLRLAVKIAGAVRKKEANIDFLYARSILSIFLLRNRYKYFYEAHIPPKNFIYRFIEKSLLRNKNLNKVVVISNELKNEYLRIFPWLSEDKVMVLHDCADFTNNIEDISKIQLKKSNDVTIGYLGHLYPGKCMEIITQIAKERPQYTFNIVGGTNEWVTYWSEYIKKQNISNIILYGYVDNCLTPNYYVSFDICILSFKENVFLGKKKKGDIGAWFSPLKLFESMSFGNAILVSDLPTIREVVDNGVDAITCNPEDINSWVNSLDYLINNPEYRIRLGENARKKVEKQYTWTSRANQILNSFIRGR